MIAGLASERNKNPRTEEEPPHRRRLLVVAGKGGVGRSSVAAGLAVAASARGDRVLAIDGTTDGGLERALEGHRSDEAGSIDCIGLRTQDALGEYLELNISVPLPGLRLGPIANAFDFLAVAAPGVREILAMGKVCSEVRKANYDLVILDAPATGHVVELLASPNTLSELVPVGPITKQTEWMREQLATDESAAIVVTLAEDLPVTETLSLVARLDDETSVQVQAIVANRLPAELGKAGEREAKRLAKTDGPLGTAALMVLARSDRAAAALEPLSVLHELPMISVTEMHGDASVADHIAPFVDELL